jgi:hypothetical protein
VLVRGRRGRGAGRRRDSKESLGGGVQQRGVCMEMEQSTREVICDLLSKLAAQHRVGVWMRGFGKVGLGLGGHYGCGLDSKHLRRVVSEGWESSKIRGTDGENKEDTGR